MSICEGSLFLSLKPKEIRYSSVERGGGGGGGGREREHASW